ncbi:peptidylprolyl isomerase [Chryseobacterium sp. FH1]|uniref:peptidylprolyl isomerase n=1 Tax=Chryseobacterium sp. FH1 TaxID=1233951 RepID=UPI0004E2B31A|nr:peptidylprolyl isomerase [Chryseobacterium sp. FH1]KFC20490.1 peptidylprolyl isomerase [Chryseobacterium sp. FH1]
MSKYKKYLFLLSVVLLLCNMNLSAQIKKGQLIDGIAAVIGDEIVLESDIEDQANYAKQQGTNVGDRCDFMESILNNKLLIYEAKKDTLIENRSAAIKEMAGNKYSQILGQFPDEKAMLVAYKFRTSYEMKTAIEKIDADNYYGQAKYGRITEKADVTPNEVTDFYNQFKFQLPNVKDEVALSKISVFPKISASHKKEIIDKLNKIKEDIKKGESFESQARIYSEDEGSAALGGLYKNINVGQMVKPFEAAALNLQENEMSDPIESEYGYHLIQLIKRNGKKYDARHILIKSTPNASEITAAKKELDSIRTLILENKITFKDAAYKYSDDKSNKFSAGIMTNNQDGSDKLEKLGLDPTISYQIAGLKKGDITEPFQQEDQQKRKLISIIQVNEIIDAHQLELATDYERVKEMALNKKKNEIVEKWVNAKIPSIFISLDDKYKDCKFHSNWLKGNVVTTTK